MNITELARRCHANGRRWFPSNHESERAAITHCTLGLDDEFDKYIEIRDGQHDGPVTA